MIAALVLTGFALLQTARLMELRPYGLRTQASVLSIFLAPATRDHPWPEGRVRLFVSDEAIGVFTTETDHPSAALTRIWTGGTVEIAVLAGNPPQIAYWPVLPEQQNRRTLIGLAIALALAAVFGLTRRYVMRR